MCFQIIIPTYLYMYMCTYTYYMHMYTHLYLSRIFLKSWKDTQAGKSDCFLGRGNGIGCWADQYRKQNHFRPTAVFLKVTIIKVFNNFHAEKFTLFGYSFLIFGQQIPLSNNHHSQDTEYFHHPSKFVVNSTLYPQPLTTVFYSCPLAFSSSLYKWNHAVCYPLRLTSFT